MTLFVKLVRLVFPLKEIKNITDVFYVDNIYIIALFFHSASRVNRQGIRDKRQETRDKRQGTRDIRTS